jgi:hypothetical protein
VEALAHDHTVNASAPYASTSPYSSPLSSATRRARWLCAGGGRAENQETLPPRGGVRSQGCVRRPYPARSGEEVGLR